MKKFSATMIAIGILVPGLVAADDLQEYINQSIRRAQEGGANVNVESHSSVSTGGQVAGAGQSVTDGDVSASSHVETHINAGTDGGTVQVKVETTKNGETVKKEYTKTTAPGEPVNVNVKAKATNEGSRIETDIQGEASTTEASDPAVIETEARADLKAQIETRFEKVLWAVPTLLKKAFGFFWGW